MSDDVLVVGGGLEGYLAALSAKRADSTASVRVLADDGRFDHETGLIDVLGFEPGDAELVADPLAAIGRLPTDHHYSVLGLETVRDALSCFDTVTDTQYLGAETEQNALFPTAVGNLTPATRYPESFANGLASSDEPMRLVGFEHVADFDADLVAARLDERVPYDVTGSAITAPFSAAEPPIAAEIAATLDDEPARRTELIEALRPELKTEPRVGVPAVLGERNARAIRHELSEALYADIFEIPIGPPHLPGRRLESLLVRTLEEHDIAVERGVTVSDFDASDGEIAQISCHDADGEKRMYRASAFVLATGGVRDGGLDGTRREITEPLFDCPVRVPADDAPVVSRAFLGNHPAVRAGVQTSEKLQPVDGTGNVVYDNLYAAGRVLESPNVVAQRSAAGLSIVTGYAAGRRAIDTV